MAEKDKAQSPAGKVFDRKLMSLILKQASPYRSKFALTGLLVLFLSGVVWVRPALIRYAVDGPMVSGDQQELLKVFLAVVALLFVEAILQYRVTYLANWVAQSVSLDLRAKLFRHIARFKLAYFDKTPVGTLVTRHVSDIDGIANVFSNGILNAIGDLLALIVVITAMFVIDPKLAWVSLMPVPLLLIATRIFQKVIKKAFVDVRNQVARMNEFVQEHVTGMHIVQSFNREEQEAEAFQALNEKHKAANIRSVWAFSVFFPLVELFSAASVALLLWLGMADVLAEQVTLGVLLQFILYVFMLYRPIRQLADRFNVLQMGIVNADRVFKLLQRDESTADSGQIQPNPIRGHIEFKNVWFAYEGENWVLRDVSFEVAPGTMAAFVGETGAGKSTVINLLTRFYEPQKGSILIDGVPVQDWPLAALREHVAVVLQDVFLFSDSLKANVTLYRQDISDEALVEAAEAVGASDLINALPDGWNADVRERGAMLSVGQRQLIAFIRAYVARPEILVLDEATSSIDAESERLIQQATERITAGRTSLVVAHRLSTVRRSDVIFVVDAGAIVESGSHDELLAARGTYARLFEKQFSAEDFTP
jgi:ATP-binding cassette subfamily B protein